MKTIWICDIACLQKNSIENKPEKRTNFRQLAFKITERRSGFKVKVVPLVIRVFGGGIEEILKELENVFEKDGLCEKIVTKMLKTMVDSEIIIRKVLSGLVQSD